MSEVPLKIHDYQWWSSVTAVSPNYMRTGSVLVWFDLLTPGLVLAPKVTDVYGKTFDGLVRQTDN